ncbi:MAG TPA: hypothetical protein VIE66_12355 [Methylocella sp.]|jgi:hypothetical protein
MVRRSVRARYPGDRARAREAIGLAQENGTESTKKEEPGIVNKVIEKVTGRSVQESDKNVDANKQDGNKAADDKSQGSRDYPDFNAIKKTK